MRSTAGGRKDGKPQPPRRSPAEAVAVVLASVEAATRTRAFNDAAGRDASAGEADEVSSSGIWWSLAAPWRARLAQLFECHFVERM
jgi:hypothetical protein